MMAIPLQPVPSQAVSAGLGDQFCLINVSQTFYGLFLDLYAIPQTPGASGTPQPIVLGAICWNLNFIVRYAYLGFSGDLAFMDTQGNDNPIFTGLGSRFQLVYLSPDEVAAAQNAQATAVLNYAMTL